MTNAAVPAADTRPGADPVAQLERALGATAALIEAIPAGCWDAPTPCRDWTVHDLVAHLVGGNAAFTAILQGRPPASAGSSAPTADRSAAELMAAYRDGAAGLSAAFAQPGVLQRTFTVPAGTVPGLAALHLRITELLVHGWDLAHATDQPTTVLPADLAVVELEFSRSQLAALPPGRSPFAPSQPAPDGAPVIDQLAALLGRPLPHPAPAVSHDPVWSAPAAVVNAYLDAFYTGDHDRAHPLVADDFAFSGPFLQVTGREAFFRSAAGLAPIVRGHQLRRQWVDHPDNTDGGAHDGSGNDTVTGAEVCSIYDVRLETPAGTGSVTMSEWHTVRAGRLATALVLFDPATLRALLPAR